ncbi:MAG: hypothetical protein V7641_3177 [Blastocatellia bacterium]
MICQIGVMGSSNDVLHEADRQRLQEIAERLGVAIASQGCSLVTGATTGLPDMVSRAARQHGGLTIGISPAISEIEHISHYKYPIDAAEVMIYTGFGLKGRNVINIRSSDIVIIFGGGMGALNEFTIAYDEGKIIGVLTGTGGIADHLREVVGFADKPTTARLIYASEPERLIDECLSAWHSRKA